MGIYVAVAGTWARHRLAHGLDPWRDWWHPTSHWAMTMADLGWMPARADPFVWSTDLDGTWLQRVFQRRRWGDWDAAAHALCYYLGHEPGVRATRPPTHRRPLLLVGHSHGGTVALLAIGQLGLCVDGLVTVSTPVRRDVLAAVPPAWRPARWLHLHGDWADRWQWLGELGDGAFGIVRRMPPPAINIEVGGGHSSILTTSEGLAQWRQILSLVPA